MTVTLTGRNEDLWMKLKQQAVLHNHSASTELAHILDREYREISGELICGDGVTTVTYKKRDIFILYVLPYDNNLSYEYIRDVIESEIARQTPRCYPVMLSGLYVEAMSVIDNGVVNESMVEALSTVLHITPEHSRDLIDRAVKTIKDIYRIGGNK